MEQLYQDCCCLTDVGTKSETEHQLEQYNQWTSLLQDFSKRSQLLQQCTSLEQSSNEFLFWDSPSSPPGVNTKVEDYYDLAIPAEETFELQAEKEPVSLKSREFSVNYPVPTFTEASDCGCSISIQLNQLRAAHEGKAGESLLRNDEAVAEHSLALAAQVAATPGPGHGHVSGSDDREFFHEFDARVEEGWVVVGRGREVDTSHDTTASFTPTSASPLKPALKHAPAPFQRPAPLRRPSNAPPPTFVDGPTPKNADDADQTCDNFKLFWEKDPNLQTPTEPPTPLTKSVSFREKISAPRLLYVHSDDEDESKEDDDRHTFDNFDRLWEKDPRFMGEPSAEVVRSKVIHKLEESEKPTSELLQINPCDMIQKHVVNVVNLTASSSSTGACKEDHRCMSNKLYDPVSKKDRRFLFEFVYELRNRNEEEGTADKTIRNAIVSICCDAQVQVVLKVEPMQDPERKFLYTFIHNIRVLSDFKLETDAEILHKSSIEVVDPSNSPLRAESIEPDVEVTHHKVTHFLVVAHRWALATTPKHQHAVLQRRMSASSSHSRAHQDSRLAQQEEHQECDDGPDGEDVRRIRPRRRSLQRSNSK